MPDASGEDANRDGSSADHAMSDATLDGADAQGDSSGDLGAEATGDDATMESSVDGGDAAVDGPDGSSDAAPDVVDVGPAAPRPVAPMSTSIVTSQRPPLRWELSAGSDGAQVELCRDRACTNVIATLTATGTTATPAADLPAGVVFWRLHGRAGGVTGTAVSPTWQFTVGHRTAPLAAAWGSVLDVNGDGAPDLAVGSPGASEPAIVYVYYNRGTALPTTADLHLTRGIVNSCTYGAVVASAGDVNGDGYGDLVVGAPGAPTLTGCLTGVHVYLGSAAGLDMARSQVLAFGDPRDGLGTSVAGVGDLDGDGYGDLVASAPGSGHVYLFRGSAAGVVMTPATTLDGGTGTSFGARVAGVGDMDGDGFPDVALSALDGTGWFVQVYRGGASGLATTPSVTLPAPLAAGMFATALAPAGDLNGDGLADLVATAPVDSRAGGRVFVYFGRATLATTPDVTLRGTSFESFGAAAAGVGDFDGDGYDDLAVGAPTLTTTSMPAHVLLYRGAATGPTDATYFDRSSVGVGAFGDERLGRALGLIGDVDGDGYSDVGIPDVSEWMYVFGGTPTGFTAAPLVSLRAATGAFGWTFALRPPARPRTPWAWLTGALVPSALVHALE